MSQPELTNVNLARFASEDLIKIKKCTAAAIYSRVDDGLQRRLRAPRRAVGDRPRLEGRLRRNFQGYTDDTAETLIGLGASAIGQYREGYVQNMPATGEYLRQVEQGGLAAVRGYVLTPDDRLRARVIALVMCECEFGFSFARIEAEFPALGRSVVDEARLFHARDTDGLTKIENGVFRLTARGRPFARSVAAAFDAHLSYGRGRHSVAV